MTFHNRTEAGERLVAELTAYRNHPQALVVALPRGGVVTGYEIAHDLHLPLDIIVPRKIGAPNNPEFAIGAITETGEGLFDADIIERYHIPREYIAREVEKEKREAQRRLQLYRSGRPAHNLENKIVLLVDDGIATGSTMRAAIASVRTKKPQKVIVVAPVVSPDTLEKLRQEADDIIYLLAPPGFMAVGEFYEEFSQTNDREVIDLMERAYENYGTNLITT